MKQLEWLICRDPVHIGGADSDSRGNRNPIYRLPDGTPVIPGSSLKGALREHAEESEEYKEFVDLWFGKEVSREKKDNSEETENTDNDYEETQTTPGAIALAWAFPLWFPVHILGHGSWWITCSGWLKRYHQLNGDSDFAFTCEPNDVYWMQEKSSEPLYFRWLKISQIKQYSGSQDLPIISSEMDKSRCLIVSDDRIKLFVDMGLVRQPRVSLKSREKYWADLEKNESKENSENNNSLVKNLFSVEALPPGAIFYFTWTTRNSRYTQNFAEEKAQNNFTIDTNNWLKFLQDEHYIGGLWSIGYGRVSILKDKKTAKNDNDSDKQLNEKSAKSPQLIPPPKISR